MTVDLISGTNSFSIAGVPYALNSILLQVTGNLIALYHQYSHPGQKIIVDATSFDQYTIDGVAPTDTNNLLDWFRNNAFSGQTINGNGSTPVFISATASAGGAPSAFRSTSLANTAVAVKASAANLYGWNIRNNTGAPIYVKFVNKAQGSTVPGTDAVVFSLMVPANGAIYQEPSCIQHAFSTAITVYACTGFADNDATSPGANNVIVELKYK